MQLARNVRTTRSPNIAGASRMRTPYCDLSNGSLEFNLLFSMTFSFGWLADGTLRYPMQGAYPGCGNRTGIIGSSEVVTDKLNTRKDAYCYKATG